MRSISCWRERVAEQRQPLPRLSLCILVILLLLSSLSPPANASGVGISVEPSCVVLTGGRSRQQLAVTLNEHDGTMYATSRPSAVSSRIRTASLR